MSSLTNSQYFESKVLTAPPHRLHLMLIEGAIRFGRTAENLLRSGDPTAAAMPLLRAIDIAGELLAGVRDNNGPINEQLAGVYAFIFRRISEAKIEGDVAALAEALKLLEFERETWQQVCAKFTPGASPPPVPRPPSHGATANLGNRSGLSFEA